ncbi:uncharacterized protein YcfJ [Sinobacterium caligoides]|uniref:Uncharacterized protein YcfJ n=1 Tax=Sinobacterium caligoides TaxID=933926 RepID=A0A3N2DE25_9GAMM|nr:glycine zipper 2TM domain-containing protein [Sinobacterium caligoides]ROR97977.1 uncharacterized protein YcfJ [Sinobacterium caligoides]
MNISAPQKLCLTGIILVSASLGLTGCNDEASKAKFAEVTGVEAVTETVKTPHEVCKDVAVTEHAAVKDTHQIAGTAIGAAVGGLIGHQVGGGHGKDAATAVGAIAGGYAGNKTQKNMQDKDTTTTYKKQCTTVNEEHEETVGYDVSYTIGDETGVVRMKQKPQVSRLPVENGKVVLAE